MGGVVDRGSWGLVGQGKLGSLVLHSLCRNSGRLRVDLAPALGVLFRIIMHVKLNNIHKTFGALRANADVCLEAPAGSIHGVLGENGAGKSTLMKILSGFLRPDGGTILLDGVEMSVGSPLEAIRVGVGMLHQDPLDFRAMTVVEDFLAGQYGTLLFSAGEVREDIRSLGSQLGFSIDPDSSIESLTVGERQQVEILRLLWCGARVLIFDEPTTGISQGQKEGLFKAMRLLASQGKTILFVSHKLEDVQVLCHRVTVLRRGEVVGRMERPFDTERLVEMMFGKHIVLGEKQCDMREEVVLKISDLGLEDHRLRMKGIDLTVRAGEIIGLSGMEGSGQQLFLQALAGLCHPVEGQIFLKGLDLTGKAHHAFRDRGVRYLPAARLEEGLIPGLTLMEHLCLVEPQGNVFVDWGQAESRSTERINEYCIRGTPSSTVESLSGGNQQRALLSLMTADLSLILLEQPTRGLDVESAIYCWRKLKDRCKGGTAILFISSDLDEILHYSDRVLVFFAGQVSEPLNGWKTTVEDLGRRIGGGELCTQQG